MTTLKDRPEWMPLYEEIESTGGDWNATNTLVLTAGQRAQLAVLEEENAHMIGYYIRSRHMKWRQAKLTALRKELA